MEEAPVDGVPRLGQALVSELPLARHCDEPRVPECGQVPGDGGLRQVQDLHDVTDAELPRAEEIQDPEPRGISKRSAIQSSQGDECG